MLYMEMGKYWAIRGKSEGGTGAKNGKEMRKRRLQEGNGGNEGAYGSADEDFNASLACALLLVHVAATVGAHGPHAVRFAIFLRLLVDLHAHINAPMNE